MIKHLLEQWDTHSDQQAVLCSVIKWKGSVPRKDYPLMLVLDDGSILGTIGGGSMELQVTNSALELIGGKSSRVFDFDMTGSDVDADVGLCGGTLQVLVEPFSSELQQFYLELLDTIPANPKVMVALSISSGSRVQRQLITSRKQIQAVDDEIHKRLSDSFEDQCSNAFTREGDRYLMWQPFSPPVIHIFGAGHVGQAVADLAQFNDLQVVVYDDREALMTQARFPYAQRVAMAFPLNREALPAIPEHDFVLIASREHRHDRELLFALLQEPPAYVGLVSSSRKWKILSTSLRSEGLSSEVLNKVHAPVGLNIEAQTVPEIAISIVSEMIACYRKSSV